MNIKQFVGIDSSFKDKNGVPMAHEEIYTKVVNAIGLKRCFSFVPASPEQIQRALETDKHLNNIPLQEWDKMHDVFKREFVRVGINCISPSNTVCTLKQAARMYVHQNL